MIRELTESFGFKKHVLALKLVSDEKGIRRKGLRRKCLVETAHAVKTAFCELSRGELSATNCRAVKSLSTNGHDTDRQTDRDTDRDTQREIVDSLLIDAPSSAPQDAIRTFCSILVYLQRTKMLMQGKQSYQYDQVSLCVCLYVLLWLGAYFVTNRKRLSWFIHTMNGGMLSCLVCMLCYIPAVWLDLRSMCMVPLLSNGCVPIGLSAKGSQLFRFSRRHCNSVVCLS